jgi:hypothetical protein
VAVADNAAAAALAVLAGPPAVDWLMPQPAEAIVQQRIAAKRSRMLYGRQHVAAVAQASARLRLR